MKKTMFLMLSTILLAFTACHKSDDPQPESAAVSVSFAEASLYLTSDATPIQIKFSAPTPSAGSLTITYAVTNVAYATDFTTTPVTVEKTITVPFLKDANSTSFTFNKIKPAAKDEVKNVVFTITSSTIGATIAGNKTIQLNFNETASLGTSLSPNVGGPMEPNQVYVDLSSGKMIDIPRVSWDLGFYSGDAFRVILNNSVKMAAKKLATANIDEVQAEDPSMLIDQGTGKVNQVDDPAGNDISKTAIAEVSATDIENNVYLINMGSNPATATPELGKEGAAGGTSRGWKKIKILRRGNDYKIQYADITATTHKEVVVSKSSAYNFTFFSLLNEKIVSVEPQKNQWDINFTTFVNIIPGPTGLTPYFFPDFVATNLRGGAKAYQVTVSASVTYDNFALSNVDNAKFTDDQRNIGGNWRGTVKGSPPRPGTNDPLPTSEFVLKDQFFYIIKDPAGNVYKLKFTGGALENKERGHPSFQYVLLK